MNYPEAPAPEALEAEIAQLSADINAATYRLLILIRHYDASGAWAAAGMGSCAAWLSWKVGLSPHAARERVRVAHALADLPRVSEAFRRGELSYSKARAITRVAKPDTEDLLLEFAQQGTAAQLERIVRGYGWLSRQEASDRNRLIHRSRACSWREDADGTIEIRVRLPADAAATVIAAIEKAQPGVPAGTPEEEQAPVDARRADALVHLAESYNASADVGATGGDQHLIHVHIDNERYATVECHGKPVGDVPAETAKRLACDCSRVMIWEDKHGAPLAIGRKSRSIPPAIRRALRARDRGCRFPGCVHTRFTHAHHIQHWADGGETTLDNLVTLCSRHHRLVHEDGFAVVSAGNNHFRFLKPDQTWLPANDDRPNTRRPRGDAGALPLSSRPERLTAADGRPGFDLSAAVGGLLERERTPSSGVPST